MDIVDEEGHSKEVVRLINIDILYMKTWIIIYSLYGVLYLNGLINFGIICIVSILLSM